ncbi:helix-turn-helix transcriptional regulator (plasmid) [Aquamicrobium terrae]
MLDRIETIRHQFARYRTLEERIDHAFEAMKELGFGTMIYDYTPVPMDSDGHIAIPSLMKLRNISSGMQEYWCDRGYFLIDPVQLLAARTSVPFFWDYEAGADIRIRHFVTSETEPVARYLLDHDMSAGVTVPIHMPHGGYATVTGTLAQGATAGDALHNIADFGLLAQVFHEAAYQAYPDTVPGLAPVQLSAREKQCLRYCADGYSAKEISRLIGRSIPTVVFHLSTATKKLGARNRTQAVTMAVRYGLLDQPEAAYRHTGIATTKN